MSNIWVKFSSDVLFFGWNFSLKVHTFLSLQQVLCSVYHSILSSISILKLQAPSLTKKYQWCQLLEFSEHSPCDLHELGLELHEEWAWNWEIDFSGELWITHLMHQYIELFLASKTPVVLIIFKFLRSFFSQ